ncbi:MAG: carboxypeptidase regulatory-like domain-containing protein, partial [Acidobacteriaceae bacterium]|nr:carboxypeptidase regulatory-like domain-containing protein [Acidobacteriaceae bacterium]
MRSAIVLVLAFAVSAWSRQDAGSEWNGVVQAENGASIGDATVELVSGTVKLSATTGPDGHYHFASVPRGRYQLVVREEKLEFVYSGALNLPVTTLAKIVVLERGALSVDLGTESAGTGGETLSAKAVSAIPLNKRDFSQLLLLAAGTMTDANGATNFTQQFAVNGQRGVEAVFAVDGADTSDPEVGGATFSNFNVDAVQEIQSSSGWMPAEIGRGAAGFTNIVTRSGTDSFHGSLFEFVRNSAFDARNFFDRR